MSSYLVSHVTSTPECISLNIDTKTKKNKDNFACKLIDQVSERS